MKLDVVLAPGLLDGHDAGGCICVVVDVLRATSTIVTALVCGASAVYPFSDVAGARSTAAALGRASCLLGGEEMGRRIAGFDLGNSPLEYLDPEAVAGKAIVFYTTNGTGAIRRAHSACGTPPYIGALLNVSAVSAAVVRAARAGSARGIGIVCAGRYGKPSAEDTLCAGLIVGGVAAGLREGGMEPETGDGAAIAASFAAENSGRIIDVLASSEHGSYLRSIGFAKDLEFAALLDEYDAVPAYDGERVVLPSSAG